MQLTTSNYGHVHSTNGAHGALGAKSPLQFIAQAIAQTPATFGVEKADMFDPDATLSVNVTSLDAKSVVGTPWQALRSVWTIGLLQPVNPLKAHIPPPEPEVVPLPPTPHPDPLTPTPTDVPPPVIEPPMPGEHVPVVDPALPGQPVIASD